MEPFEPYALEHVHRLIEPGPTRLVSTSDGERATLMTDGFTMPVRHGEVVALVLGPWDASVATLRSTGECVLAIPDAGLVRVVVDIGNCSGADAATAPSRRTASTSTCGTA